MIRRYRLRPVEAIQYLGTPESVRQVAAFVEWAWRDVDESGRHPRVFVGGGSTRTCCVGDWVVRFADGRYAVMSPKEFAVYEEIP